MWTLIRKNYNKICERNCSLRTQYQCHIFYQKHKIKNKKITSMRIISSRSRKNIHHYFCEFMLFLTLKSGMNIKNTKSNQISRYPEFYN